MGEIVRPGPEFDGDRGLLFLIEVGLDGYRDFLNLVGEVFDGYRDFPNLAGNGFDCYRNFLNFVVLDLVGYNLLDLEVEGLDGYRYLLGVYGYRNVIGVDGYMGLQFSVGVLFADDTYLM